MGEFIIRIRPDSDKSHKKAVKVAAEVRGVQSVTMTGMDRDLLVVIGDGVDASKLTKKLRKEVGEAEIVELRTTGEAGGSGEALPGGAIVRHCRSPCQCRPSPGRPSLQRGGYMSYPVPALPAVGSPGAARRWAGEHSRQAAVAGYYCPSARSPSYYYCASPVAWECGYGGSSYALAAARSHPGHHCTVIERHDYRRRQRWEKRQRQPGCCSVM